jgi:hypothetical protein
MTSELSAAQAAMLEHVSQCPHGYCDYMHNRTLAALHKRGLVEPTNIVPDFGYNPRTHRAGGGEKQADWVLTECGRTVLRLAEAGQ